jgi:hypothetical protein
MLRRPSEHRLSLEERVAVVVAIAIAVGVHLAIFAGGSGIGRITREERKRERLMVIRRVREITPAPEPMVRVPDPRRAQAAPEAPPLGAPAAESPKPEQKVSPHGVLPPPKAEVSPAMEEELQESIRKKEGDLGPREEQKSSEVGDNSVSVVTDVAAASFSINGPSEYRGTGTFWIRRGAPPGTYRIAFGAVEGFGTPPPQTKELQEKGQIVFVGKYRRSTEIVVESNVPGARVTVYRPDGRSIDLSCPGRVLLDDPPSGVYTAVFKDVPGHIAPAPISKNLAPGSGLSFFGEYRQSPLARAQETAAAEKEAAAAKEAAEREAAGGASGAGGRKSGRSDAGGGTGSGRKGTGLAGPEEGGLDRRVQMVVKSYPSTDIERGFDPIPYPGVIIRRSNFQQGWCQVYLIVDVDEEGRARHITIERPTQESRPQFDALIRAVEAAVRSWDYDRVKAEVHVDVRFYVE